MFARLIELKLKPNSIDALNDKQENEVLPLLRRQPGFKDLLSIVSSDGRKVYVINLWDSEQSAAAYERDAYATVQKLVRPLLEDDILVTHCKVLNSTIHGIVSV